MTCAPIPHGLTPTQVGRRIMWARRREKYGPSGFTAAELERRRKRMAALGRRRKTHCKRGHKLTDANVYLWGPNRRGYMVRFCRACTRIRLGRFRQRRTHREWASIELASLKAAMLAAHPDRGGTPSAFIRARAAYERFLRKEQSHAA